MAKGKMVYGLSSLWKERRVALHSKMLSVNKHKLVGTAGVSGRLTVAVYGPSNLKHLDLIHQCHNFYS